MNLSISGRTACRGACRLASPRESGMSHAIPVFLIPLNADEVPQKLERWNDAEQLIGVKIKDKIDNKIFCITSLNWWVQHAISLICTDLRITGLDFVMKEIAAVFESELIRAGEALEPLFKIIGGGIPKLNPDSEKEGSIWGLRKYHEKGNEVPFTGKEIGSAYAKAGIFSDLCVSDSGYQSDVDFFSSIETY
jgi:hypothetical protein